MKISAQKLRKMLKRVGDTREHELDCNGCFDQLERFVELVLAGQDASAILPLVQNHLEQCPDCLEEYTTLMRAVQRGDED